MKNNHKKRGWKDKILNSKLPLLMFFLILVSGVYANLVYDNGNVGIGRTDPPEELSFTTSGRIHWAYHPSSSNSRSYGFAKDRINYGDFEILSSDAQDDTLDTSRFIIDKDGNVGIGTTSPGKKLEVYATGEESSIRINQGDTVNNAVVQLRANGANKYMFGYDGSSGNFDITGASFASNKFVSVDTSGNVGIGTTNPTSGTGVSRVLEISGPDSGLSLNSTTSGVRWSIDSQTSGKMFISQGGTARMVIENNTGNVGIGTTSPGSYKLYVAGNAYTTGTWAGSDIRWKKNIKPLDNSLNKVLQLQGVNYEWKTKEYLNMSFTEGKQIGLIAQDVEKVIPEIVYTGEDSYKSISYEKLTSVLVEAIKEQQSQIKELKARIEKLENEKRA